MRDYAVVVSTRVPDERGAREALAVMPPTAPHRRLAHEPLDRAHRYAGLAIRRQRGRRAACGIAAAGAAAALCRRDAATALEAQPPRHHRRLPRRRLSPASR